MNMNFISKLPIPQEIKAQYPLSEEASDIKIARDREIKRVFSGEDDRMVLVIGPCSADREDAVMEYIGRLRLVQDKVADKLIIIPRIYTNKPRTTGEGYKGLLHQPDPEKDSDLRLGLIAMRRLHTNVLAETGLSTADEMVYPAGRVPEHSPDVPGWLDAQMAFFTEIGFQITDNLEEET